MRYSPTTRFFSRWLSLVGIVALSYLAGAAVIVFGLPSSDFIERAFVGARAWSETNSAPPLGDEPLGRPRLASAAPQTDDASQTFDGFTLYACVDNEGEGAEAQLIDMRGELAHRWTVPKWRLRLYQPEAADGQKAVHNFKPGFFGLHLTVRGELLVVPHGAQPIAGCGLLKLDENSDIVWEYAAPVHHDIDVSQDGTIYAIQSEMLNEMPAGLEHIATPCESDQVVLLSPDGKPLREPISILEALRKSPYAVLLSPLGNKRETRTNELLHTNFVRVLRPELAPKFPAFKAGQVLISMRHLDAIAVLDIDAGSIVWAASGPWRAQHAPQFLDNGHLLIFDNRGGLNGSRVLEYDPQIQAFPWWYPGVGGRTFYSSERGMAQRLPNGNTLIVDSEGGEIIEVNHKQELVWSYSTGHFITTARRYSEKELPFLRGQPARKSKSAAIDDAPEA